MVEYQTRDAAEPAEFCADHRQWFAGIAGVVRERGSPHAVRLLFPADTDYVGMLGCLPGSVQNEDGVHARRHNRTIGEGNPLSLILREKPITDTPVGFLVLAPIRMDLLRRSAVVVRLPGFAWVTVDCIIEVTLILQ